MNVWNIAIFRVQNINFSCFLPFHVLDLNSSVNRKSTNGTPDSFHIAFGSKVTGVRNSQSAGKKSSREVSIKTSEIV